MVRVRGKCWREWIGKDKRMLLRIGFVLESGVQQTFVTVHQRPIVHKPNIGYIDLVRCADPVGFAVRHGLNG